MIGTILITLGAIGFGVTGWLAKAAWQESEGLAGAEEAVRKTNDNSLLMLHKPRHGGFIMRFLGAPLARLRDQYVAQFVEHRRLNLLRCIISETWLIGRDSCTFVLPESMGTGSPLTIIVT